MITVPARLPGVVCTAKVTAQHRCPFRPETDTGQLEVSWATTDQTLELHSLAEYVASFSDVETSHEDLVQTVIRQLRSSGVDPRAVRWTGSTAGLDVTVEVSHAVLRQPVDRAGA